ncbi:Ank3 [Symbiodinium natans]|uniref:Ank3 protein n=1 Tax=Symbiodinium natans TaxID=878477 RepID=A0A812U630_9DINO|nr:Ank3 [Symbiodinium natans]
MLRVFMVSGEEFATHIGGDLNDVRSLKRHLWKTRGVSRFRQKLLYNGVVLDDHTTLDQPLDLQLVLMSFVKVGRLQLEAFSEAFASGHVQQVEEMLHRLHDPNQRDRKRQCPLLDAGASTDGVLPDPTTGIGSHRVLHDPAILTLLLDAAARAGKVDLQNLPLLYRTKSSKA